MSTVKAIVWKEYAILCTNKKGLFLMMLGYIAFIGIFIWAKISTKGFQIEEFESNINYASLTVSYMIFISSLKFWQEKSMQTLEVLFMLPTSIIGIIMAKTIVPICISQISVVSFYLIANGVCMIFTGQTCGSIVMLLQIAVLSCLVWVGLWMMIVANDVIYQKIVTPVWVAMLILTFVYFIFCVQKSLVFDEKILEDYTYEIRI